MSCYSECSGAWFTRRFWEPKIVGSNPTIPTIKSTIRKVDVTHTANSIVYSLVMNNCGFESCNI